MLPRTSVLLGAGKWSHKMILQILPPVPTAGLTMDNLDELVEGRPWSDGFGIPSNLARSRSLVNPNGFGQKSLE